MCVCVFVCLCARVCVRESCCETVVKAGYVWLFGPSSLLLLVLPRLLFCVFCGKVVLFSLKVLSRLCVCTKLVLFPLEVVGRRESPGYR